MLARPRSRWFGCCRRPNRGALDEVAAAGSTSPIGCPGSLPAIPPDSGADAPHASPRHCRARGAPPATSVTVFGPSKGNAASGIANPHP